MESDKLTFIAEGAKKSSETFAVAGDVVACPIAVDTLRTHLTATMAIEARRTCCGGKIHIMAHHVHSVMLCVLGIAF